MPKYNDVEVTDSWETLREGGSIKEYWKRKKKKSVYAEHMVGRLLYIGHASINYDYYVPLER